MLKVVRIWQQLLEFRCAWKKFRELSPFLTSKGVFLKLKGKVCASCVRSCMIYGSETWPMKKESETKFETTEMRMIQRMCGVSLRDKKTSSELRAEWEWKLQGRYVGETG
jgi:hypothetical protein